MSTSRVFVVGSLNRDTSAQVPRVVETGETALSTQVRRGLGGKGLNQAVAAARMGGDVRMIGAVGDDVIGRDMRQALEQEAGLDVSGVLDLAGQSTGEAFVQIDEEGDNAIVVLPGANGVLDAQHVRTELESARTGDVLLVQLEVPLGTVRAALATARDRGVLTVLNAAPAADVADLLPLVDVLVVNDAEAEALLGSAADEPARELADRHDLVAVVTLGSDGAGYSDRGDGPRLEPSIPISPIDTTGAGDAFVGALAVRLGEGAELADAAGFANLLAARVCLAEGAQGYSERRAAIDRLVMASSDG